MKVRELIQALGQMDPELEVFMPSTVSDHGRIALVTLDLASAAHGDAQLCYEGDEGAFAVVRLVGVGEHLDGPTRPVPDELESR